MFFKEAILHFKNKQTLTVFILAIDLEILA